MTTPSTNGGHPIAFDTAGQVELQLERLRQRIDEHVQQASQGKDKAFVEQLRTMLQQSVLGPLAEMVNDNITVNGMSWQDHTLHQAQATQPVNAALLRSTIETQDAAFQLSNSNAVKRITKCSQLASQVEQRVSRVVRSGQDKADLLDSQRSMRASELTVQDTHYQALAEVEHDLQGAERELAQAASHTALLRDTSRRAVSLDADVALMRQQSRG